MSEGVVLLHGLLRNRLHMRPLARFLTKQGYKVLNLSYASSRYAVEEIARQLESKIQVFSHTVDTIHFVGYSMGGLVARAYIHRYRPKNLGRVVLLGTPNQGSEVADKFKDHFIYRKLSGPAGRQLVTNFAHAADIFGRVDYELGSIAGNRPIDPYGSSIIGRPNDGKVSVDSTRIDGMKDHIVVPVNHTFFPGNRRIKDLTLAFLKTGNFAPEHAV